MKKKFVILLLIIFNIGAYSQKINQIKVVSAPLYTTSTFRISCIDFDRNFTKLKRDFLIKDKNEIRQMKFFFSKFKTKKLSAIDVRAKLIVCYENKAINVICMDEFGNFFRNNKFYENESLFNFLIQHKLIEY